MKAAVGCLFGLCLALSLTASAVGVQLATSSPVVAAPGQHPPDAGGFEAPVAGAQLSQRFGCTALSFEPLQPACPLRHWHSGVDLAAPSGTRVVATLAGRISVVVSASGYGLHVIVDHGAGLSSLYGHLSEVSAPDGAVVDAGTPIGLVGSTGNSTGPHLHFEIRRDGIAEDPGLDLRLP